MKVLILSTHLNPGGISRYILNLSSGLVKKGITVFCASSGGLWTKDLENLGVKHKFIPIKTKSILSFKIILSFFLLFPFIKKNKINLIHSNSRVTQFLGYLLYKFLNIPYISTFHGFYKKSIFRRLFKFSGLKTIAVSNSVKKHLIYDLGINREKIKVVYNGIDLDKFFLKKNNKTSFGFKKDDFLIGILGRISEEKGHFLAVNAFLNLLNKYKNIYLLICGKGRLENKLKKFIDENKIQNVKFVDLKGEDFLDIIDLLLVPSKKEGFGYSVVEAFAKEVSVVAFNTGGINEIIKDRENGVLFYDYSSYSLERAIELVISDGFLREKIVNYAKEYVKKFSIEKMATNTLNIYKEVLNEKN